MAANHAPPSTLGGGPSGGGDFTRQEAADYIASLLESLRPIAEQAKLSFLAYLIAIALEEAKKRGRISVVLVGIIDQGHELAAMALEPAGEV